MVPTQSTDFPPAIHPRRDLRALPGVNIRRLMARFDMTLQEVVDATGLDERTLRSMAHGVTRPHARTLHKLASGLGVETDELFQEPLLQGLAAFDRTTNPVVAEVIGAHPELIAGWSPAEFKELYSRFAVGGELTEAGALAAAHYMNTRRELFRQAAVVLESREAEVLQEFIALLYRRVTTLE